MPHGRRVWHHRRVNSLSSANTVRNWWVATVDRARTSLFVLPMVAVVLAVATGAGLVALDSILDDAGRVPLVFTSTVDSARVILSTVAAATISFAGIAFSVSLLVIQRTSAQYSPRVVQTLFRDPFNRRVMAMVVGTFTYCVVVLRSVRAPIAEDGTAVVPNLSVSFALLMGIGAILAIVAFIDHSARAMDVSEILQRVSGDSIAQMRITLPELGDDDGVVEAAVDFVDAPVHHVVRFESGGWVQRLDIGALKQLTPANGGLRVHTAPGRYAVDGTGLCSVWGSVDDLGELDRCIRTTLTVGNSRTLQQDPSYGLRQSVDVALRALSPGVNDPTTAQDAIFHTAAMLVELLGRAAVAQVQRGPAGGVLVLPELPGHDELVDLAYDEVRRAAAPHATVCVYLLESIAQVRSSVEFDGRRQGIERLERQAELVVECSDAAGAIAHDRVLVRQAYRSRFTTSSTTPGSGT